MKKTALVMAVLLSTSIAWAQKSFTDVIEDKKLDKAITMNAPGNLLDAQFQQLTLKKVALISFYLMDEGDQDAYSWIGLGEDGGNKIASVAHSMSIAGIKKEFTNSGIELLQPAEFLNSDAKKEAYSSYEMELGPGFKIVMNTVNRIASAGSGLQVSATAPGYEFIPAGDAAGDLKLGESLADLAIALEVDAVAVAYIKTRTDKKDTYFVAAGIHLFGKNPIEKIPGKKYPGKSYTTGMNIGGAAYKAKGQFSFVSYKKKAVEEESYDGLDELLQKIAAKLLKETQARIQGS